jgi:N-acetylneuraminic acid mutarotase
MRTYVALLLAGMLSLGAYASSEAQSWAERAPIGTPRWNPGSAVLDGRIYIIGGQRGTAPYPSTAEVEVYDPSSDTWSIGAPMSNDRWGLMVAVADGRIYAIGGQTGSFTGGYTSSGAVEEYDATTDRWTARTSMPTPRGWGGCAVYDDTIFVFGGYRSPSDETVAVVEKYHPASDTWSSDPQMPSPRYTFATASVNGLIYLIGGWSSNVLQRYDPAAKVWSTGAPMPTWRGGSGIEVLDGNILVVGGRGGNSNELEAYDPQADAWTALTPMPTPREGLVAGVVDGRLYVITGSVPISQGGLPYLTTNEQASFPAAGDEGGAEPGSFGLLPARPNQFRAHTTMPYSVPWPGRVTVSVTDVVGRAVRVLIDDVQGAGHHSVDWHGRDDKGRQLADGLYFYRVEWEDCSAVRSCLLLGSRPSG